MENGTIRDSQITASSAYDSRHNASNGRLNFRRHGQTVGAWSSKTQNNNQWLQVDFQRSAIITGISTQGRDSYHNQYVKNYKISFSVNGAKFHNYTEPNGMSKVSWLAVFFVRNKKLPFVFIIFVLILDIRRKQ